MKAMKICVCWPMEVIFFNLAVFMLTVIMIIGLNCD